MKKLISMKSNTKKLVLDFEKEVQQIFNFINLDFDNECLDFHKTKESFRQQV